MVVVKHASLVVVGGLNCALEGVPLARGDSLARRLVVDQCRTDRRARELAPGPEHNLEASVLESQSGADAVGVRSAGAVDTWIVTIM